MQSLQSLSVQIVHIADVLSNIIKASCSDEFAYAADLLMPKLEKLNKYWLAGSEGFESDQLAISWSNWSVANIWSPTELDFTQLVSGAAISVIGRSERHAWLDNAWAIADWRAWNFQRLPQYQITSRVLQRWELWKSMGSLIPVKAYHSPFPILSGASLPIRLPLALYSKKVVLAGCSFQMCGSQAQMCLHHSVVQHWGNAFFMRTQCFHSPIGFVWHYDASLGEARILTENVNHLQYSVSQHILPWLEQGPAVWNHQQFDLPHMQATEHMLYSTWQGARQSSFLISSAEWRSVLALFDVVWKLLQTFQAHAF